MKTKLWKQLTKPWDELIYKHRKKKSIGKNGKNKDESVGEI